MPRVSVVLCTYNREELLPRSASSVLRQTISDLELIIVDDGSTDGTQAFLAGLTDTRVRTFTLSRNGGQAAARNAGVELARSSLVAFQDSDDEWLPEKLERQLPVLERTDSSTCLVSCDMERVDADGVVTVARAPEVRRGALVSDDIGFYQAYGLGIQSVILKRECLDRVGGFDPVYRCFDDLELFTRLSEQYDFERVPEPLVRYHDVGGVSDDRAAELAARARLLRRHGAQLARRHPGFLLRETARVAKGTLGAKARGVGALSRWFDDGERAAPREPRAGRFE